MDPGDPIVGPAAANRHLNPPAGHLPKPPKQIPTAVPARARVSSGTRPGTAVPPDVIIQRPLPSLRRPFLAAAAACLASLATLPASRAETNLQAGRTYRLVNMNSFLVLDGTTTGTQLQQATPTGNSVGPAHQDVWTASSGTYGWVFTDYHTGACMAASLTTPAQVTQLAATGHSEQGWTATKQSDGSYTLQNYHTGFLLGVTGDSTTPGALINAAASDGNASQHWAFEEVSGGVGVARVYMGGGAEYTEYPGAANWSYTQRTSTGSTSPTA